MDNIMKDTINNYLDNVTDEQHSSMVESVGGSFSDYEKREHTKNVFNPLNGKIKTPKLTKSNFENMFPLMGRMGDDDWYNLKLIITSVGEKTYIRSLTKFYKGKYGVTPRTNFMEVK